MKDLKYQSEYYLSGDICSKCKKVLGVERFYDIEYTLENKFDLYRRKEIKSYYCLNCKIEIKHSTLYDEYLEGEYWVNSYCYPSFHPITYEHQLKINQKCYTIFDELVKQNLIELS